MKPRFWNILTIGFILAMVFTFGYITGREAEQRIWTVDMDTETQVIECSCSQHRLTITAPCHIAEVSWFDRLIPVVEKDNREENERW